MQILFVLILVLVVGTAVWVSRSRRDQELITARVAEMGGRLLQLKRQQKGTPFADIGRGWWAWRVDWERAGSPRVGWALTTRDGIKEWRD